MALKRSTKPKAPWTRAFPEQHWEKKMTKKYVNPQSKVRAEQMRQYRRERPFFLAEHPWCVAHLLSKPPKLVKATEVHHTRGRRGALLLIQKHWLSMCSICHDDIGRNPNNARKLGLLCEKGKWGVIE